MREAIGGTWIFQIVIFFILLFTGYMCLSINHSKAFNVKNTIVKAIEREEGVDLKNPENDPAIQRIVEYLKQTSYRTTGSCPEDVRDATGKVITHYYGFNREGKLDSRNPAFCIAEQSVRKSSDMPIMNYYRIKVFYQLDLPIFRSLFGFQVSGDTKIMSRSGGLSR